MQRIQEIIEQGRKTDVKTLFEIFDELEPASIDQVTGRWRGEEFITGHFMEGALESSGWYGKEFKSREEVHPLLYFKDAKRTKTFALNPAWASFHPFVLGLMKTSAAHFIVRLLRPIVQNKKHTARLRMIEYRGKSSVTMVYDVLPIMDMFRRLDAHTLLGVMDMRGMDMPYFFLLRRVR